MKKFDVIDLLYHKMNYICLETLKIHNSLLIDSEGASLLEFWAGCLKIVSYIDIQAVIWPIDFRDLIRTFSNPENPIYISILIVTILFALIFVLFKFLINPTAARFREEKANLELQSAKLMAMFAELDPDPVIRTDKFGNIIETNIAAQMVFSSGNLKGKNIRNLLPNIGTDSETIFDVDQSKVFTKKINNRFYSILVRTEPSLEIVQIYFRDITELKNYEAKLVESEKKLRELSDHLQDILEGERNRIAQGLHDGIGQSLSLLRIRFLKLCEDKKNFSKMQKYESFIKTLDSTIVELKEISYSLRPKMLEEMGIGIALKHLANKITLETGIIGQSNIIGDEIRLSNKLEICLYRIAQEATNNIIKYSKATNFSIEVLITPKKARLMITDNGIGFDYDRVMDFSGPSKAMGLMNMKERSKSFGGLFKVESSLGKGTMIVTEIPLKKEYVWQSQNQYA